MALRTCLRTGEALRGCASFQRSIPHAPCCTHANRERACFAHVQESDLSPLVVLQPFRTVISIALTPKPGAHCTWSPDYQTNRGSARQKAVSAELQCTQPQYSAGCSPAGDVTASSALPTAYACSLIPNHWVSRGAGQQPKTA